MSTGAAWLPKKGLFLQGKANSCRQTGVIENLKQKG